MVFLQAPYKLSYNRTTVLRMGRTTLCLQAKRNWTAALRGTFFDKQSKQSKAQVTELHAQICENVMSKDGRSAKLTIIRCYDF